MYESGTFCRASIYIKIYILCILIIHIISGFALRMYITQTVLYLISFIVNLSSSNVV